MNDLMAVLGKNVQYIRKLKGLTQEELAEKCEMQTSYLAGVERATRNITIQTLEKIIVGLDVLPEELFDLSKFHEKQAPIKKSLLKELEYKLANCNETELKLITKLVDNVHEAFKE